MGTADERQLEVSHESRDVLDVSAWEGRVAELAIAVAAKRDAVGQLEQWDAQGVRSPAPLHVQVVTGFIAGFIVASALVLLLV